MRCIIAGSREGFSYDDVVSAVELSGWRNLITEVVSGTARGVDRLGEQWAEKHHIPVIEFPADWDRHGRAAGYIRNAQMAEYADCLIALWDGTSKGTENMIQCARKNFIPTFVYNGV